MRECTKCLISKEESEFTFSKTGKNQLAYRCRSCDKSYRTEHKTAIRQYQFKRLYGITTEDYERLKTQQNGVCAICSKSCGSGRSLAVDHCHETDEVRGLLCIPCNQGLGSFRDNPDLLTKAINYLKKYK